MSFRCVLTIMVTDSKRGRSLPKEQVSPLCFKTEEECLDFGKVMFKPPQTVLSWRVAETDNPAKFRFKDGKVRRELKGGF